LCLFVFLAFDCHQRHDACTVSVTQVFNLVDTEAFSLGQGRSSYHEVLTFSADFGLFAVSREVSTRNEDVINIYE